MGKLLSKTKKTNKKELQVISRRDAITTLRLEGLDTRAISAELKLRYGIELSHVSVWKEIKAIESEWLDRVVNKTQELKVRQLEEIEQVKNNMKEFCDDMTGARKPETIEQMMQAAEDDPFMNKPKLYLKAQDILLKCLTMQGKLLGLDKEEEKQEDPHKHAKVEEQRQELFNLLMGKMINIPKPKERVINGECSVQSQST